MKKTIDGILAGILICIGGAVFLSLSGRTAGEKIAGAVLFSVALLCICLRGYSLYTGKIGLIVKNHKKEDFSTLFLGLLGNAIATVAFGFLLGYAIPALKTTAKTLCEGKLQQSFVSALVRATFCGILMFLAVGVYRENHSIVGILFCIPTFILSGFEHSIADIFYFATSGICSWKAFGYLWTIILGNSIGAMLLPFLKLLGEKCEKSVPPADEGSEKPQEK